MEDQAPLATLPTETDAAAKMRDLEQAGAFSRSGRFTECQSICEAILHQAPSHRGALLLLGNTRVRLNDLQGALPLFETLTRLDPAHAVGWHQRGLCLVGLLRFAEAVECLEQSTRLQPDNAMGRHHLGGTLAFLGRYTEALPILEQALVLAPDNPSIQAIYASTLKWTRGPDAAMRQYLFLTETFPNFVQGWVGKALLHLDFLAHGSYMPPWVSFRKDGS